MNPKPHHIAVRQLIRKLSTTPNGYTMADAKGMLGAEQSHNHTDRMIKAGQLVRVKVPGHLLHFVKTQEMADALTAVLLAGKKKRIRKSTARPKARRVKVAPSTPRYSPLRIMILAMAANPMGVTHADGVRDGIKANAFSKCMTRLVDAELVFRGKVKGNLFRYFGSAADAAAWQATTPPQILPRKPRVLKQKAVKVAKPKIDKLVKRKPVPLVARKQYSPPAPRVNAVIVWPAHIRTQYSPFVDLRALNASNVPRQLIGTPSWVSL